MRSPMYTTFVLILVVTSTYAQSPEQSERLAQLKQQRLVQLRQLAETHRARFSSGLEPMEFYAHSTDQLISTQIDTAETDQARIGAIRRRLKMARELELYAQARHETAADGSYPMISAAAHRMAVRIQLIEAQPPKTVQEKLQLETLKRQRTEKLTQAVNLLKTRYQVGVEPISTYLNSVAELSRAELQLAETESEKTAALQRGLTRVRAAETVARNRFKAGRETQTDLSLAELHRLQAETSLLQQQQSTSPNDREKLRRQKQEFVDKLNQWNSQARQQYEFGIDPIQSQFQQLDMLVEAGVNQAETDLERLTVLRQRLRHARKWEAIVRARVGLGHESVPHLNSAQAHRLTAEIELLERVKR